MNKMIFTVEEEHGIGFSATYELSRETEFFDVEV